MSDAIDGKARGEAADGSASSKAGGAARDVRGALEPARKYVVDNAAPGIAATAGRAWSWLATLWKRIAYRARLSVLFAQADLKDAGVASARDVPKAFARAHLDLAQIALTLRLGLGILFIIGGWSKLSKLLSTGASDAMVMNYTSTTGYINEFFMNFLFPVGSWITPWQFLTTLSAFELFTGLMLVFGQFVRPIALIYGFLLWTFVLALPVVTTNGVDPGVKTYMAPAILVQIRDVALSGMMFTLYILGSGYRSLDRQMFGDDAIKPLAGWDALGLLLRLSLASVLIVGGLFAGMPSIKSFVEPGIIMTVTGFALLWGGRIGKIAAAVACGIVLVYIAGKLGWSKGIVGNLNAIKREIALFAGFLVLALKGGGMIWTGPDILARFAQAWWAAKVNLRRVGAASTRAQARFGLILLECTRRTWGAPHIPMACGVPQFLSRRYVATTGAESETGFQPAAM